MKNSLLASACTLTVLGLSSANNVGCVSTTKEIRDKQEAGKLEIVVCPGTVFNVNVPQQPNYSDFDGIAILKDDVSIKCGVDGSSSNNCVLSGGFQHVAAVARSVFTDDFVSTNNLLIQGFTFTGQMQDVPHGLGPTNIMLSASGKNMKIKDCIFEDIYDTGRVVALAKAYPEISNALFPPNSADLTIENSVFRNIQGVPHAHILTVSQTVSLHNCNMTDLTTKAKKYASLFSSVSGGVITVKNVNIEKSSAYSSPVLVFSPEEGVDHFVVEDQSLTLQDFKIHDQANQDPGDYCEGIFYADLGAVPEGCDPIPGVLKEVSTQQSNRYSNETPKTTETSYAQKTKLYKKEKSTKALKAPKKEKASKKEKVWKKEAHNLRVRG